MVKIILSLYILGWFTFYITTPCYALTVWTTDGKHFVIVDGKNTTKDVDIGYIRRNAQKYKNFYWKRIYVMAQDSKNQWKKHRGIK